MNCANHDNVPAIATCTKCARPLCEQCAIHWRGGVICKLCLESENLQSTEKRRFGKSPGLAALCSLMPGLGQIYVGYYRSGFLNILIVSGIITILAGGRVAGLEPFLGVFLAFFWMFNMIDAARKARIYNEHVSGSEQPKLPTDSPLVGGVLLLILGLFLTLEITFGLRLHFIESIWPLAILGGGIYLLWKYKKTQQELNERRDRSPEPTEAQPHGAGTAGSQYAGMEHREDSGQDPDA